MKRVFCGYIILSLIILFVSLFLGDCKKPERIVKVITLDVLEENISYDEVVLKGEIIDIGKGAVTDYGIAFRNTEQSGSSFTNISPGSVVAEAVFEISLSNPLPNTLYEFKAYASVSTETIYGKIKTFTSLELKVPVLTTTQVTGISMDSAKAGGYISDNCGSEITGRGICWNTTENPTILDQKTIDLNPGTGSFVNYLSGLDPATTYFVRAYATNSTGTAYGNQVSFKTLSPTIPVITTAEVTGITTYTAVSGGDITSNGGSEITTRGICWNTDENPTIENNIGYTDEGSGDGTFTSTIINLEQGTTYYVRAYATNSVGTGYGIQVMFKTLEEYGNYITYGDGVTDIDGNNYTTVIIGGQEWMAENLCTTNYKDGTNMSTGGDDTNWQTATSGAYAVYPDYLVDGISSDMQMRETYGLLYNWHAVNNSSGLCPDGWRVPTNEDWNQLTEYLINNYDEMNTDNVGNKLKSCRQIDSPLGGDCATDEQPLWGADDTQYGTDNFGFSAFPGGHRSTEGHYFNFKYYGYWWSSTEYEESTAYSRVLDFQSGDVGVSTDDKKYGYSVRCLKD